MVSRFTRLERRTRAGRAGGVTRVRDTESVVLMGFHAHVRFRSFRDELSLTENDLRRLQESQLGFLGKSRKNPVSDVGDPDALDQFGQRPFEAKRARIDIALGQDGIKKSA